MTFHAPYFLVTVMHAWLVQLDSWHKYINFSPTLPRTPSGLKKIKKCTHS